MDISTNYLGLKLKNPIVPSASPLSKDLGSIRQMEDAGAAAIVMYSLFEEQIELESEQLDHYLNNGTESFAESLNYFPDMSAYNVGPEEYLERIRRAKQAVKIPIIGSLNGVSSGGWTRYAKLIQDAGADALELNVYYIPTNPDTSGQDIEKMYIEALKAVKKNVTIPVAIKIGPYFSATANMVRRLAQAGADGIVMFNRFYQPDIDLETKEVVPHLTLSTSGALTLPLRWVAILYKQVQADLAVSGGIHTHSDVLKAVMVGATVTQMASELLQKNIGRISEILKQVEQWMRENEYDSLDQMRGSMSQQNVAEPAAFERANYMKVLQSFSQDPAGRKP